MRSALTRSWSFSGRISMYGVKIRAAMAIFSRRLSREFSRKYRKCMVVGGVIAPLGVGLSHAPQNPCLDSAACVMIGLVMITAAALLARKIVNRPVGASLDQGQNAKVRAILATDPAAERVGHLLTVQMGPDSVLLTAKLRFQRDLGLYQFEQAIERLERAIKLSGPTIMHFCLECGKLKQATPEAM